MRKYALQPTRVTSEPTRSIQSGNWSAHTTGRRTFIVNALSLGIPPNIVMKWTGHSDYSSMKPYIDIVDDIKATSMTKFNGLLEKND
jgi:Phage integrase family.